MYPYSLTSRKYTDFFFEIVSFILRSILRSYLSLPVPLPRLPSQVMWACARIRYAHTQYTSDLRRRNRAISQRYRAGMPFPRGWIARWPLAYGRAGACHIYEGVTSHTQMSHVALLPTNCKVALNMRARWSSKGLCVITHPCVWCDSFVCIQMSIARRPLICGCAGTYIRHWVMSHINELTLVRWLTHMYSHGICEVTHPYVFTWELRNDSLMCIHMCMNETHSYVYEWVPYEWVMAYIWMSHGTHMNESMRLSFICDIPHSNVPWLNYMCRDSIICALGVHLVQ